MNAVGSTAPLVQSGRQPRLLFVVPDAAFFVSHRLNLAVAAIEEGYRVAVACPAGPAVDRILAVGAEHCPIRAARRSTNPLRELPTFLSIAAAFRAFRPDIAHTITSKAIIYGGLVARAARIPTLAAISGLGRVFVATSGRGRVLRYLVSLGYRAALNGPHSTVLFQNPDDLALFQRCGILRHTRFAMIAGSGVDLAKVRAQALPRGAAVVGLPSRLIRDKGVVEFAEAARILRDRGVRARFRLIGDPDLNNPTSLTPDEIQAWVDEGIIEWQHYMADVNAALAACTIVVLPSYREGFPKTLIDAAAAGRAMAASDVPGCRHAIVPGQTGLLFPPRDAAAMADVLEEMIKDPERVAAMGKAARAHAERAYSIGDVTARHLQLYREMLSSTDLN